MPLACWLKALGNMEVLSFSHGLESHLLRSKKCRAYLRTVGLHRGYSESLGGPSTCQRLTSRLLPEHDVKCQGGIRPAAGRHRNQARRPKFSAQAVLAASCSRFCTQDAAVRVTN